MIIRKKMERNDTNFFSRIYGGGNYEESVNKYRQSRRKLFLIFIVVLCLVFLLSGISILTQKSYLVLDSNKKPEGIKITGKENFQEEIKLTIKTDYEERILKLWIKPAGKKRGEKEEIHDYSLDEAEREIRFWMETMWERGRPGETIKLPLSAKSGASYHWSQVKKNNLWLLTFLAIIMYLAYKFLDKNYLRKLEKKSMDSVIKQLPFFITQLVLFLEAGLVITNALERIIVNYSISNLQTENYFYDQLSRSKKIAEETKSDLVAELASFAYRTRLTDFIRIMALIEENRLVGSELKEKLLMESYLIWEGRKKKAIEDGKLAETKLALPLMLQLLAVIIITTAPVFMDM